MSLETKINKQIRAQGAITVADYMAMALFDPEEGYYRQAAALGKEGDFITAPEISQLFGEMIAVWLAHCWQELGNPAMYRLVELGPGRGTLMSDILRTFKRLSLPQPHIHLVEINETLIKQQKQTLTPYDSSTLHWHDRFEDIPTDAPLLIIANEFFDAIPINQYIKIGKFWHEKRVYLDDKSQLKFMVSKSPVRKKIPFPSTAKEGFVS